MLAAFFFVGGIVRHRWRSEVSIFGGPRRGAVTTVGVRLGRPISQKHKCQILGLVLHKDTSKFRFDQYAWQRTRVRAKRG